MRNLSLPAPTGPGFRRVDSRTRSGPGQIGVPGVTTHDRRQTSKSGRYSRRCRQGRHEGSVHARLRLAWPQIRPPPGRVLGAEGNTTGTPVSACSGLRGSPGCWSPGGAQAGITVHPGVGWQPEVQDHGRPGGDVDPGGQERRAAGWVVRGAERVRHEQEPPGRIEPHRAAGQERGSPEGCDDLTQFPRWRSGMRRLS